MNEIRRPTESTRDGRDMFARTLRDAPESHEQPSPFLRTRIHDAISRRSAKPASSNPWRLGLALAAVIALAGGLSIAILAPESPSANPSADLSEVARVAREFSNDLRAIDDKLARRARAVLIEPVRREVGGLDRGLRSLLDSFRPSALPQATG